MNTTETMLNGLLDHIEKTRGSLPSYVTAVYHIKDCKKQEVKDLAAKLNQTLVTPENNIYADCYTVAIDVQQNERVLVHSKAVQFECKEVEGE